MLGSLPIIHWSTSSLPFCLKLSLGWGGKFECFLLVLLILRLSALRSSFTATSMSFWVCGLFCVLGSSWIWLSLSKLSNTGDKVPIDWQICDGFSGFIGSQETNSTLSSLVYMLHVHVYWHITSRSPVYIHKSTPQKLLSKMRRKSVRLLDKQISSFTGVVSTTGCRKYW